MTIEVVELPPGVAPCETFCEACGQLRLWLRPEWPKQCGNCGAPDPLVGGIGGVLLKVLRDEWRPKE